MPLRNKPLRILISNDDSIYAQGIKVLERMARTLTDDVWVVAPLSEQSGAAHSLTLNRPLRVKQHGENHFSVDGTPTDCVMMALSQIMRSQPPTLVLSGVNHGGNLGEDVTYSGTVAAAMEATLLGIPAIAFSQVCQDEFIFENSPAEHYGPEIIQHLIQIGWPTNVLININFPDVSPEEVKGVRIVKQGLRNIRDNIVKSKDPHGRPYYWVGGPRDDSPTEEETDLEAIHEKAIAVTPLHLNLTHDSALEQLKLAFL